MDKNLTVDPVIRLDPECKSVNIKGAHESIPLAYAAGGPLRQPYSCSVTIPHRFFTNSSTEFNSSLKRLKVRSQSLASRYDKAIPTPFLTAIHCSKIELVFVNLLRSLGIDSQPGGPVRQPYLSYRPGRLHRLAESNLGIDS
jgi:hypothetical protein